jgi:MFS family permease
MTLVGYAVNLFAVPVLALAGRWETAAALLIAERMGETLRTAARDAMLSFATKETGRGWGFGLHEAMDQIGAVVGLVAAGYVDFPLIAYHFEKASSVPDTWIPLLYAVAMGVDALAALSFGRWFDRAGISILMIVSLISALFAPLVFLGGFRLAVVGMAIWGIGMGAQESVLRAAIAEMVSPQRRGSAYGIFNTGFGVFWFLGSALMGVLYDVSLPGLIAFSVVMQLASVPLFFWVGKRLRR